MVRATPILPPQVASFRAVDVRGSETRSSRFAATQLVPAGSSPHTPLLVRAGSGAAGGPVPPSPGGAVRAAGDRIGLAAGGVGVAAGHRAEPAGGDVVDATGDRSLAAGRGTGLAPAHALHAGVGAGLEQRRRAAGDVVATGAHR